MSDRFDEIQAVIKKLTKEPTDVIKTHVKAVATDFENLETVFGLLKEALKEELKEELQDDKNIHALAFLRILNKQLGYESNIAGMTEDEIEALEKMKAFYSEGDNRQTFWKKLTSLSEEPINNLFGDEIKGDGEMEAVKLMVLPNPGFDGGLNFLFALGAATGKF